MVTLLMCGADIISLAGSKVSARSVSPGGSAVALSDRLSLASGSLPGTVHENPLPPQQLGVMGMRMKSNHLNIDSSLLARI